MGAAFGSRGSGWSCQVGPGMGGGFKRCTPPWTRQWVDGPDLGGVLTRGDFRVQGAWGFSGQVGFGMGMASGGVGCLGHVDMWVVLVEGGTGDRGELSRRMV